MNRFATTFALAVAALIPSLGACGGDPSAAATAAPTPEKGGSPKAVVCVAIDQMRWDYYPRFKQYLGESGFRRIERDGQVSFDCRYEYANTVTAAGHATLMTGVNPRQHGILGNGFWDRNEKQDVHNCADPKTKMVTPDGVSEANGYSPFRRVRPAVGDDLIKTTEGRGKTLSVSMKDRSAIMMGPATGKDVYWFDFKNDEFVTSTHYRDSLPEWLTKWQAGKPQDRWAGQQWKMKQQPAEYEKNCTIDDFAGESGGKFPKTFPKNFDKEVGVNYYDQMETSPMGDELIMDAALEGMKAMEIGKDEVPDLVTISLSCFDKAGHQYGPNSWEMMDFFIYEDMQIARLLDFLDKEVGEGEYLVVISADHGVTSLPEFTQSKGGKAGRINERKMLDAAKVEMESKFGAIADPLIVTFANPFFVIAPGIPSDPGVEEVAEELRDWSKRLVGVRDAWTRKELNAATPAEPLKYAAKLSMSSFGGGDVYVMPEPDFFFSGYPLGTTHGNAAESDQRVSMWAMGRGYGKFRTDGGTGSELPQAKSPRFMAQAARAALGIPQVPEE